MGSMHFTFDSPNPRFRGSFGEAFGEAGALKILSFHSKIMRHQLACGQVYQHSSCRTFFYVSYAKKKNR